MVPSAYDLRAFYTSKAGRVVRRIVQQRLKQIWPSVAGLRVAGFGYATPYLRPFVADAERVLALMPSMQGAHLWPHVNSHEKNLVALFEETHIPLETASLDRVLLIHNLEFSGFVGHYLSEIWRVLKSNGRLLVVVPSRSGFWARAEWSPFGQGTPFSVAQICQYLRDHRFIHENTHEALFMPPLRMTPVLKAGFMLEDIGRRYCPILPGLHIVEATKQVYAKASPGPGSKVLVGGRLFTPRPAAQNVKIGRHSSAFDCNEHKG